MLYALTCIDAPNSTALRAKHSAEHRERIIATQKAGNLFMAGPLFNDDSEISHHGSLIIVDFNTLEEARGWADAEPFLKYGIYERIIVTKFKKLF